MELSKKMMAAAAKAALLAAKENVNTTCNQFLYQSTIPTAALALKK